jgi:hypothetical protein
MSHHHCTVAWAFGLQASCHLHSPARHTGIEAEHLDSCSPCLTLQRCSRETPTSLTSTFAQVTFRGIRFFDSTNDTVSEIVCMTICFGIRALISMQCWLWAPVKAICLKWQRIHLASCKRRFSATGSKISKHRTKCKLIRHFAQQQG